MSNLGETKDNRSRQILIETLFIFILTIALSFIFRQMSGMFSIIPIVYLLFERKKRGRTWSDIGFKFKDTIKDVKNNWYLIIIVGAVIQFLVVTIAKYYIPGFFEHIKGRIPLLNISLVIPLLISIFIGTFMEEIVYRGFFQERVSWFIKPTYAIILLSIVFGMMHYSSDSFTIVAYDVGTVFIDSIFYGIIFNRTKNIFASWSGHLLADLVGLILLLFYV